MKSNKILLMLALCFILAMGLVACGDRPVEDGNGDGDDPSIQISKAPDTQTVSAGDTATFTITVTNSISLSNMSVSDPLTPDCDRFLGDLLQGSSVAYTCETGPLFADFTNVATVTADPPAGSPVTDNDDAFVDVVDTSVNVTGIWVGTWTSTVISGFSGNFKVTLSQDGANVTGIILFTANACFIDGEVSGTLNGADISFVATAPSGVEQVSFTGTISNNQMSGNQKGTGGSCATQDGTFLLNKNESESDCFEEQPTSGCDDQVCEDAVCALDPSCCDEIWDLQCVDAAIDNCTP